MHENTLGDNVDDLTANHLSYLIPNRGTFEGLADIIRGLEAEATNRLSVSLHLQQVIMAEVISIKPVLIASLGESQRLLCSLVDS